MSGTEYLLDTNSVLYFLAGNDCMKPYLKSHFSISIITEMELLSFSKLTPEDESNIKKFLKQCVILPVNESIKDKAIVLRRNHNIKLPDAIISATAIVHGLTFLTADRALSRVSELDIVILNP